MFKNYSQITLATLTGFMIGSLNKIWPWRNVIATRINSKGVEVEMDAQKVMPTDYIPFQNAVDDPLVFISVITLIAGFALVFLLSKFDKESS